MKARPGGHYGRYHARTGEGRGEPMLPESSTAVQKSLRLLWDVGAVGGLTDASLLEQFLGGPDEVAEASFAALVERHGPTVRRVGLDLLGDPHEAQDVAQATFLVLAR